MPAVTDPFKAGYDAARQGAPLDACRYRQPDRRNAWVRGWHQGQADQVMEPLSSEAKARGKAHLQEIRQRLNGLEWLSWKWFREKDGRYYSVYLQPDLFGHWVLTSVWGRRGTELGRIRHTPCTSYDDGLARLESIRTRRRQHGYSELIF